MATALGSFAEKHGSDTRLKTCTWRCKRNAHGHSDHTCIAVVNSASVLIVAGAREGDLRD